MNALRLLGRLKKVLIIVAVALLITGCATTDRAYRGMVGVVDPDRTRLSTDLKWLTPPSDMGLRECAVDRRIVFLRCKNSTGSDFPELFRGIRDTFERAGYQVTDDPNLAEYTVLADLRYLGETRETMGLIPLLTGAAIGGVTGAVIGHNVGSGGHATEGAVAGAAVGGAMAGIMGNRNKMVELAIVVDLRIGERIKGGVDTVRTGTRDASISHGATVATGGGVDGGHSSSSTSDQQEVVRKDDFFYHSNRVAASASKLGLTFEEAAPVISARTAYAIGAVLP